MDFSIYLACASFLVGGGALTGVIAGARKLGQWQGELQTKAACEARGERCAGRLEVKLDHLTEAVTTQGKALSRIEGRLNGDEPR